MTTAVETNQRAPVSRGWVAGYGLMYFGQHLSWAAPVQILLAVQVLELYPQDKERMLALLMAAGGLAAVIAGPVAGHLADATRTRLGRRLPWMIGGSLVAAGMLAVAGLTQDYVALLIVWVVFQVALAASQTSAQSIPPDRVPQHQYGRVSGVMGLTYTAAVVVGSALGAALPTRAAYLAVGAVMLVSLVPFAFTYREPEAPRVERRAGFALPRLDEARDFWWVFLARLLVTLAQSIALFYLLYFLRDQVHYSDPETGVLILSAIYAVFVIISAIWSGRASDRSGKRRRFVSLSSFGVAIACLVMAVATDFTVVMAAAGLLGVSWGVFQAIDQALINHVLPSADDRAAHIGIVNLAVHIPNTAAPALAALLVMYAGGYFGLYSVAAALTMVGGLVVWKVRGVP
ncbi:MFS transporter [Janibacter cremeus]|uniref:MFS family permease n=1 Tax=Janibacter cremeus TaxID=1285192 RepID=A0A852VPE6_9MICO|nr:MFS family permease [Janibacter cremeus]